MAATVVHLSRIRAATSAALRTRRRGSRALRFAIDGAALGDFLRRQHPRNAAAHVAALAGVSPRTAEGWLTGREPSFEHALQLIAAYGPALVNAVVVPTPAWSREAELAERRRIVAEEIALLEGELKTLEGRG